MSHLGTVLRRLYPGAEAQARERAKGLMDEVAGLGGDGEGPILLSVPGRTELGGNHTDHNGGRVLAAAVRLDAMAAVRASGDESIVILSRGMGRTELVLDAALEPRADEAGTTAALVRGLARALRDAGWRTGGFRAVIDSRVPVGSGLSSSACIEVLMGLSFSELFNGGKVPHKELALAGRRAENEFFGKPCGLMDQMACALGGIRAMDFRDELLPRTRRVRFDPEASGYRLGIVRTGGSHADLTADYAAIPAEMRSVAAALGRERLRGVSMEDLLGRAAELRAAAGDRAVLRALHFTGEDARAAEMARALGRGSFRRFLKLVRASGASSWTLLGNVDAPGDPRERSLALALGLSQAFLGGKGAARVHGGGFAGTIQAWVPQKRAADWAALMDDVFGSGAVLFPGIREEGALRLG